MNFVLGLTVFSCALIWGHAFLAPTGESLTHVTAFVTSAANFAVNKLNAMSNDIYWYTLYNITHPTVQPVIGFLYKMDLVMIESQCRNIQSHVNANTTQCPQKTGAHVKTCHVAVHDVTSNNPRYQLTVHHCTPIS